MQPSPVDVQETAKSEQPAPRRRPMNAYMLFCADVREDLMKNEPELTHKTVMQRLGELWKSMSDDLQRPYRERARLLQDEFKQENPVYKYKPRKQKAVESSAQLSLPPGISVSEASYLMFVGMQVLMNGQQKIPSWLSGLAGKLAQFKTLSDMLAEEAKKKDEVFDLGLVPFTLDQQKKE